MEYDCQADDVSEEYCVHIMSRTTSIDPAKLQAMIEYAGEFESFNDYISDSARVQLFGSS